MLDRLLESGVRRKQSPWSETASVVVHVAIIGLGVVATASGEQPQKFRHDDVHILRMDAPPSTGAR